MSRHNIAAAEPRIDIMSMRGDSTDAQIRLARSLGFPNGSILDRQCRALVNNINTLFLTYAPADS